MVEQEEMVVAGDPEAPCVIEWSERSSFEVAGLDSLWVAYAIDATLLPDGRLVLVDIADVEQLLVARPGVGGSWIGRGGEGPGEYRWIRFARVHEDRLHVFDLRNVRRTVLDAESFEVLGTNQLLGMNPPDMLLDGEVLDESRYVINATLRSPDRVGYALHLFDGEGRVLRSEAPSWPWTPRSYPKA